jgi:hypothetical protein
VKFGIGLHFTYPLVETDAVTGLVTASFAGTYTIGGEDPDGFPVLTMVSDDEIILEAGISTAFEGIWLRVNPTLTLQLGRLG